MQAATTELLADIAGERLDTFIARRMPELTRARVQRLIADGAVAVAAERVKPALRLALGQLVTVDVPPPAASRAAPERIALDIIFEDADVLAVNKPPRMAVHPAGAQVSGTLVNAI